MAEPIVISEQTKSLIESLRHLDNKVLLLPWTLTQKNECQVSFKDVLDWLKQTTDYSVKEKLRFDRESLRVSLLKDLHLHLLKRHPNSARKKISQNKITWWTRCLFILLATAGTLLAVCDGFDGVTSILSLFIGIPMWLIFLTGAAFSLLSLTVFYGFDLVQISQNLGVEWSQSRKMIDVFVDQVEEIKSIRKLIRNNYNKIDSKKLNELQELQDILSMLQMRHDNLKLIREAYTRDRKQSYLRAVKLFVALVAGLLFFSSGFFSGQSLAIALISLFMSSVSITFWPVILMSVVIGLAAFSIYWFVERPGLQNLVSSWLGFDKEKIARLADDDIVAKEGRKMSELKFSITERHGMFSQRSNTDAARIHVENPSSDAVGAEPCAIP